METDGFDTKHPLFICYVAETNKHIIGYTILYYTYSTWYGKAMYLEDLYITPNYRGKHIGSKLLKTIAKVNFLKYYIILYYKKLHYNKLHVNILYPYIHICRKQ